MIKSKVVKDRWCICIYRAMILWYSWLPTVLRGLNIKGEVSPGILCRLGEWRMILETKQQKFGQIWIIQSRDRIFKGFINFVYVALSGGTLPVSVMSQQYSCLMELYTNFLQNFTFHENVTSLFFLIYLGMLGLWWMFMHIWNELDQKDYWYPRKIKNCENLCTKSMESCPLVISHILAEFHPERTTYTTLHNHCSWMDCPNLLKLLLLDF